MRRIFAIWALCLCWGVLNAAPLGPFNATLLEKLKTDYLGSKNPRLHMDETMIALSISAASNPDARLALEQIPKLKGCQAHTSVMLSSVDILSFRKLGVELTCEPKFEQGKKQQ